MKNIILFVFIKSFYFNLGIKCNIVVVDFGIKYFILWELVKCDCNVIVLFYIVMVIQVLNLYVDGVFLFNGFGDLLEMMVVVEMVKEVE